MALNPAYEQQTTRILPFAVGHVYVQGDATNNITGFDGSVLGIYELGMGEWESLLYFSLTAQDRFLTLDPTLVGGVSAYPAANRFVSAITYNREVYAHFHGGGFTTKGLPNSLISLGPDQNGDAWTQYFPSITPPQLYNGIAYLIARVTPATFLGSPQGTLAPVGIYRSLRCRIFDANGNVTGYGFTVNPTWQMVEAQLRFKIKPQQPGLMGLTNAEKACFDWPAMVDHAARNAEILPNGAPRFTGNYLFAADSKLGNIMETMLRGCRSYRRERGSQLAFIGDDARSTVFTFSQRHLVPGSLRLSKKDVSSAPNVYVPQYRELNIPAVAEVVTAETVQVAGGWETIFTTDSTQPFFAKDYFTYSGSADDADFAGDYQVYPYGSYVNNLFVYGPPPIANQFNSTSGPGSAKTTTGGYLGTQQSRFKQYAPTVVQHRAHQRMAGQIGLGINALPRALQVPYDLGNCTFDQSNRIMQYMMIRDLGPDSAQWVSPVQGTLSAYLEGIDEDGNAVIEVEAGDVIALDETASSEFQGQYEVTKIDDALQPAADGGSTVALALQPYQPTAFTDTSYAPGDSYQTLTNSSLPTSDIVPEQQPYWVLQCTPVGTPSGDDTTMTVNIADLTVQWAGLPAPTTYGNISLAGVALGSAICLLLNFVDSVTLPTLSLAATSVSGGGVIYPTGYPTPLPWGQFLVFVGITYTSSTLPLGSGAFRVHPASITGSSGTLLFVAGGGVLSAPAYASTASPSVTTLTISPASVSTTTAVTLTAQVASGLGGPIPTGTVQFTSDGSDLGAPVALAAGVATLSGETFSPAGTFAIQAIYSGDSVYTPSAAAASLVTTADGTGSGSTGTGGGGSSGGHTGSGYTGDYGY